MQKNTPFNHLLIPTKLQAVSTDKEKSGFKKKKIKTSLIAKIMNPG